MESKASPVSLEIPVSRGPDREHPAQLSASSRLDGGVVVPADLGRTIVKVSVHSHSALIQL